MSVTFTDDSTAVEHLIQEIGRPLGARRPPAASPAPDRAPRGNRRRGPRVNVVASDMSVDVNGETVCALDFSTRGIQFRCLSRLVPGSTILLSLRWRQEAPSVALGRVMWATFEKPKSSASPHYRVGVVFESADVRIIRNMLQQCDVMQSSNHVQVVQYRR